LKECHEEVLKQIKMWNEADYFTDAQLEDAKAILRRSFIRNQEKPSSLASQLTYNWCSATFEYFTDLETNYQKVSREDVKQYIARYIKDKPFIAGMVINGEMNKKLQPSNYFKN
jgi:zinc protease